MKTLSLPTRVYLLACLFVLSKQSIKNLVILYLILVMAEESDDAPEPEGSIHPTDGTGTGKDSAFVITLIHI